MFRAEASLTGGEGREPARIGLYAPLFLAGGVLATYTIGAVFGSRRTGRGERVDASLFEILASSMDRGGPNLVAYQYSGSLMTTRTASQLRNAMPNGVFRCTDGYVSITGQPQFFPRMARMIDRPDLAEDEAFRAPRRPGVPARGRAAAHRVAQPPHQARGDGARTGRGPPDQRA